MITPAKYAAKKGVTRQTIYNWIKNGEDNTGKKIKTKKISGVIFIC